VPIDARGLLTAAAVARVMDDTVAALMVTNPNTLGLFEEEILQIADVVHGRAASSTWTAPT
jgi:glycine dehydrogenase subunit 2